MIHFDPTFVLFCLWLLVGVFGGSGEVSVMEGDSVTLNSGLTELKDDDLIQWRFGDENTLIAEINMIANRVTVFNDVPDGRFRDRLKLNKHTGSLTITNTRAEHTGRYKLQTNSEIKSFTLNVYAMPVPVIIRNSSQCSSSSCPVVCSVVNVSHVTLSWLKGNSLLSSISVSDLSISLSLPLEVEDQDTNNYSCVLNNSITHQTTHLDISGVCQPCEASSPEVSAPCCGCTEDVTRLVLSALVGVATVIVLVYDIRSTRGGDKKQTPCERSF